jgi:uncharacterized protein YjbI with pentapeptide repeats
MSAIPENLYGANLREADLRWANLREADLREADLYGADLRGANLRWANLYEADLRGADLRGANLYRADLYGADLRGANLRGADLRGATTSWPLLSMSTPSGWVNLTPVGNDWTLTIGCWTSTVEALRELIAGEDWPDADEHERLRRRPILSALADLCDAHIAYYGTNPLGSPTEAVKA